jgi:hypothetical protein
MRKYEDNIETEFEEIRCDCVDWFQLTQKNLSGELFVSTAVDIRVS